MKTINKQIIGYAILSACCAFAQANEFIVTNSTEYPAQLTIKVLGDDGNPIAGIGVGCSTFSKHIPGSEFGTDEYKTVTGLTDTNGIVILTFPCITGEVAYNTRPFAGFYGNAGSENVRFTNVVFGKWQPWNPTKEIYLQRILNLIPMYARRVDGIRIPIEGKPVGFDLEAGDWIAPYGKGMTADFIFQVEIKPARWITNWYGTSPRPYPLQDNKMTITFSNKGDGIQSAAPLLHGFRVARQAPSQGYEPVLEKTQYDQTVGMVHQNTRIQHHTNLNKNENYFFRVRTKKDTQGNIVSALYGKIYGEFNNGGGIGDKVSFTYYLNPKPNSLDMEFDPSQNLFKKLPFNERVSAP